MEQIHTYEQLLLKLLAGREELVILTAENRAAIRNLPQTVGNRFIDFGICEMTMLGAAAGLALRGRIPVAHALAAFLTLRAYEFARTDIGIPGLPVKLVGGVPGFLSEANGPTHQAIEDIAVMRSIPSMNIFCPADLQEMLLGLEQVLLSESPFYIRYNPAPAVVEHTPAFRIGEAEVFGRGSDAALITYGFLFGETYRASQILEQRGIRCRVVNLRTVKPVDEAALLEAALSSSMTVTIEDHFVTGGLYSIVAEVLLRNRITCDVLPVAFEHRWFKPALLADALRYEGFAAAQLAARIEQALMPVRRRAERELVLS